MRSGDDVIGASRVHNGCDQLLVQVLPVVHPLSIINAETIDRALDWNIQQLQLLLKEGLLAPVSLFHNPDLVRNTQLICARHPATAMVGYPCLCRSKEDEDTQCMLLLCLLGSVSPECDPLTNALKGSKLPGWGSATVQLRHEAGRKA